MDVTDFQGIDQGAAVIEQHFPLEGRVEYHSGHHTQDERKTRGQIEPGLFQNSQAHADLIFCITGQATQPRNRLPAPVQTVVSKYT